MKIITVGDIHGRDYWKNINPNNYDKIIFVGDYVDSYNISNPEILFNLKNIIQFKKDNKEKVILLLGNHDLPYLFNNFKKYGCTGNRFEMIWDLNEIFMTNRKLFQVSYQIDNYIWTHAGIHQGWYKKYILNVEPWLIERLSVDKLTFDNLSDKLNLLFELNYEPLFYVSKIRGGSKNEGGIFWADWIEIYKKPLKNFNQIFGHTYRAKIRTYERNYNSTITCVDRGDFKDFHELVL
jgi:predicted MPP superfamily phosphohydrolase